MFAQNSPTLNWELRPNQRSFTIDVPVQSNSAGFRDREFPVAKGPNTVRILILGDSVTFGIGTPVEATYPHQLERMLNAHFPQRRFEVFNMGVPGYNTRQELITLKEKGLKYAPDFVVIGFYWNDILGNDKPLPWEPGFVSEPPAVGADGHMLWAPRHAIPNPLRDPLRQWRTLYITVQRIKALKEMLIPSSHPYHVHFRALLRGDEAYLERGWRATEPRLAEFVELAQAYGFTLLLVSFPDAVQMQEKYANIPYQPRIRIIADRLGIPHIDLFSDFKRSIEASHSPFIHYDNAHPNKVGHAIAARALFSTLLSHLVPG